MNIVLFRNGSRALILHADKNLMDCPPMVRQWLGPPESDAVAELTETTPMLGIHVPQLLAEVLQHGFCALDTEGVVRTFRAVAESPAGATKGLCTEEPSLSKPNG